MQDQTIVPGEAERRADLEDAAGVSSRQGELAVRLLRKALDEGEAPEALVGGLFAELRRLLLARELTPPIDPNRDGPRIGARPFKVADLVRHSKEFSPAALRSAVIRLSAIDRALKTGRAAPAAALEQWVLSPRLQRRCSSPFMAPGSASARSRDDVLQCVRASLLGLL